MSVLVIPHAAWEDPNYPVSGPSSYPDQWAYNTIHWPGANVNVNDPVGALRGMQSSWVNSKGYSLGYNFAVFPDGSAYEIRGFDICCAANGNQDVNRPGIAILMAVPNVDTEPTEAMCRSVTDLVAYTRDRVSQELSINGHRDVRPEPTQCPGEVIYSMICDGYFEPSGSVSIPPTGDDGMVFRTNQTADAIFAQGSDFNVRHVSAQEGFIAQATQPGWSDSAPTIDVPADVAVWLNSLVK